VALERMAARRYALVLVDWAMPEMDGLAFTSAWRRRESGGRVPIVGLSARALAGDRERALAAGMDEYLHKPVPIDTLADVLARWLPAVPGPAPAAAPAPPGPLTDAAEPASLRFDRRALERFVGSDDPNRVREVLADCFASFPAMLEDILKASDREALGRAAHAAKGVAACVGALELKDTLAALEREASVGELSALLGLARRARREFDALVGHCTALGLAGPVPGMEEVA
jgi:HPt (histidine-containing phosphotransfer) domain-containing protein